MQRVDIAASTAAVVDHVIAGAGAVQVGITPTPTGQPVVAGATIQRVAAVVAEQAIGEGVAGTTQAGCAGQFQILQVGAERVVDRGADGVSALVDRLADAVPALRNHIDVVAAAAGHRVVAGIAIQQVVASAAQKRVVAAAAQ
ncbi:hypothetical protein D9M69_455900 [compost metagenome]